MNLDINKIDWGNDSAEKDPNLMEYFVDHPALERLYKRSKTFIIGRKGSGKSAIRKKFIETSSGWEDDYIIEISPTFNIFSNIIADNDIRDNFNKEIFFQYVWLNFIYKKALIEIGKKPKNDNSDVFDFAIRLAKDNDQRDKNLLESAQELLNKLKIKAGKLGDLGVEIEKIIRKNSDIEVYENELSKICNAGYKVSWIIDDLDLGWNNSIVANNMLLGLLTCSNYVKNISQNLHIFICLREDVYRILLTHTQHSDKYRDVEKVSWNADSLMALLEERVKYNYRINNIEFNGDSLFGKVFPDKVGVLLIANWLAERTLGRPRELLQLSRLYSENNSTKIPDQEIFKQVELEYSNWKLEDLSSEFSNQYPNIYELFKFWKSRFFRYKYNLKLSEFEDMFLIMATELDISSDWYMKIVNELDPKKLLKILFDIGFIGDFILGGAGGSKTIYSYNEVHEPILEDFQIHPCFRKAMGTVDRIRKKK
nr:hypothetical protein [uncultured Carboxylicivirga sp.]